MKKPDLIKPLSLKTSQQFNLKLYDPLFEEFIIYSVVMSDTNSINQISFTGWSIALALKGDLVLIKESNGDKIEVKQYSAWLLESGKYTVASLKDTAELYIATEKTV